MAHVLVILAVPFTTAVMGLAFVLAVGAATPEARPEAGTGEAQL